MANRTDDPGATVLIVEDQADYAHNLMARHFARDYTVEFAYNIPQARRALQHLTDLALAIVDLDLPGGTQFDPHRPGGYGFEIVKLARQRFPRADVVVLTAHVYPALINATHRLGAEFVAKENCDANLKLLARRVAAQAAGLNKGAAIFAAEFSVEHNLSTRHTEILGLAVRGLRHAEIADALSLSRNTIKTHIREILQATGETSLREIARRYWERIGR